MTPPPPDPRLRLRAVDDEDLLVISAQMQDAIVPVSDISFLPAERALMLAVNRFMWNAAPDPAVGGEGDGPEAADGGPVYRRCTCAVRIGAVDRVQTRALDLRDRGRMLAVLQIAHTDGQIAITFADGPELRALVTGVDVLMEDFGAPWPTRRSPAHPETPDPATPPA